MIAYVLRVANVTELLRPPFRKMEDSEVYSSPPVHEVKASHRECDWNDARLDQEQWSLVMSESNRHRKRGFGFLFPDKYSV